ISRGEFRILLGSAYDNQDVQVDIYDAAGRLLKSFDGVNSSGIIWYGDDNYNRRVAPGAYFLRLSIKGEAVPLSKIEKVVFID
ncbi:MAG: T9SS type A sorting domain-containing protein, partial [bacterium]